MLPGFCWAEDAVFEAILVIEHSEGGGHMLTLDIPFQSAFWRFLLAAGCWTGFVRMNTKVAGYMEQCAINQRLVEKQKKRPATKKTVIFQFVSAYSSGRVTTREGRRVL